MKYNIHLSLPCRYNTIRMSTQADVLHLLGILCICSFSSGRYFLIEYNYEDSVESKSYNKTGDTVKESKTYNDYTGETSDAMEDVSGWESGCGIPPDKAIDDDYISGGDEATENNYPWIVRIMGWVTHIYRLEVLGV